MRRTFIALAVLAAAPVVLASAIDVPRLLSYQGRLTDTLGMPVPDTLHVVHFRFYTRPTGGTHFWGESLAVRTDDGLFSVLLGSTNPIGSVPDSGGLYLGMTVGAGPELAPRLRVVSAAYAMKADTANHALTGGDDAWVRDRPDSVLFTVRRLGICRGGSDNALHGPSPETHTNLGISCTTGTRDQDHGFCTVGGGLGNSAGGAYSTVGGGSGNSTGGSYAAVAGGSGNAAIASRATVAGGRHNAATGTNATVAGGKFNVAGGYCAFVGGGVDNVAANGYATVAGGSGNHAEGWTATAGGGFSNTASGAYATIPGGSNNVARGFGSLAAGFRAHASHAGGFVWSDSATSEAESVYTTGPNQFRARARGGTWFFSNAAMTTGAYLAPGSNSWASACDSAGKEDFREVDRQALLERVAALPVRDYKMRDQHDGTRHIGPVAQDFAAAFGYGETNTAINLADADGVLLAAVQALYEQNRKLRGELEALKSEVHRR